MVSAPVKRGGAVGAVITCRPFMAIGVMATDDLISRLTSGFSGGKSRHLFHRRKLRQSLFEQSICFIFHLIAIAVRCPCLQPAETFGVDASGKMVPDLAAAEIFAPGDYCLLKLLAAL